MVNLEKQILSTSIKEIIEDLKKNAANIDFFISYIEPLIIDSIENKTIFLLTDNNFSKQVISKDYLPIIKTKLNQKNNSNYDLALITNNEKKTNLYFEKEYKTIVHEGLNKNFTFDNYFISEFNNSAYLAAKSISSDFFINPLFICGGVGLGKTHLLHAIGNEFIKAYSNKSVKYVSSDDFSREIYNSLHNDNKLLIEEVKRKYESYDLLLIDDIQILSKREKINEILFNIFNANISKNKFVIWTSDKNPDNIPGFEDRMKSRFYSGMFVTINRPQSNEIRNLIIKKVDKILKNYVLTPEAITYLSNRNKGDIRRMEGDIYQILFYASNNLKKGSLIPLEELKKIYAPVSSDDIVNFGYDVDPNLVISEICTIYSVKEELIKSKSKFKQLVAPRNVCMYVLRKKYNMTYTQIGSYFSNRNHSTVMDAIEKVEKILKTDRDLSLLIENVYKKI